MLLLLVSLLVRLLQITNITCLTPYSTTLTIFSLNQCIYTIAIVLGVLRTQEKHHSPVNSTIFWHRLLLIYFAKCFSGVAELTTQLLRLIGILWLPLCRINKLGYTYPRRLLRSPTLVGHQDYFLAPLPGSIALLISSLGKYTLAFYLLYRSCCQWLIYSKLDLIGKVGSWMINKNIISNTACLKKGNTYGHK